MRTAIVGVGMAGLACAERLAGRGHVLTLLDKGRGPGGRMSTRRVATEAGKANFDHGAQYFMVRDPGFRTRVDAWVATGCVAPWVAAGAEAFVGVPGMNAPTDGGQESLSRPRPVTKPRPASHSDRSYPPRPSPDCDVDGASSHICRCPVLLVLLFFFRDALRGKESLAEAWRRRSGSWKSLKVIAFQDF